MLDKLRELASGQAGLPFFNEFIALNNQYYEDPVVHDYLI